MRYRPAPALPNPALLAVMLLLMVLFLGSLPKLVFAAETTATATTATESLKATEATKTATKTTTKSTVESDAMPRYTLTPKEVSEKVAEAIVATGIAGIVEATITLEDPHTVYGADEPIAAEVSGLHADAKNKKWSASIIFKNGDHVLSAIPMEGKFQAMIELPSLKKAYRSGEIIAADDITIQKFPNHYARSDMITEKDALIGKAVKRNISVNRPIREHEVADALVMKKNALVQINYSNNNLHITTSGQVLADAAVGDVVEVRNTNSNHVVRAVVKDSQTVSVLPFVQTSALGGSNAPINN